LDGLQLLEQQGEVANLDVGAQRAGGFSALKEPLRGLMGRVACLMQLVGGGEASGEAQRQRAGSSVQAAAHECGEGGPGVALAGRSGAHGWQSCYIEYIREPHLFGTNHSVLTAAKRLTDCCQPRRCTLLGVDWNRIICSE